MCARFHTNSVVSSPFSITHVGYYGPVRGAVRPAHPSSRPSPNAARIRCEREHEHLANRPASISQPSGHGRGPLAVSLRPAFATPIHGLSEPHTERLVRAHEMVVGPPPFEMQQQLRCLLHGCPCPPNEGRHALPQRQIHPLDKGGVQPPTQPKLREGISQCRMRSTAHHVPDPHHLPAPIGLFDLPVNQLGCDLPLAGLPPHP